MRVTLIKLLNIVKGDSSFSQCYLKGYFILPTILVIFYICFFLISEFLFDENKCNIDTVILQNVPYSKEDSSE